MPDTVPEQTLKFSDMQYTQKSRSIEHILDKIINLAAEVDTDALDIMCFIGLRYFGSSKMGNNPILADIFKSLAETGDEFHSKFKLEMPIDDVTFLKTHIGISQREYDILRNMLQSYVQLPSTKVLRNHIRDELTPISKDFIINGRIVGKYYPLKDVWTMKILDVLNHFYGDAKELIPNELYVHGGLGLDG